MTTGVAVAIAVWLGPATQLAAPTLQDVLNRAAAYVEHFNQVVASVVAEEHYRQIYVIPDAVPSGRGPRPYQERRELRSDFLMVRSQESDAWIPFRDVFEVDGKRVREREERLTKLLLDSSGSMYERAWRLTEEAARYNIGPVQRTVNVPTQAMQFLRPLDQPRSVFRKAGEERIDGVVVWEIQYEEVGLPTLIRTNGGASLPAAGTFWIDPVTGVVLRSVIRTRIDDLRAEITVNFHPSDVVDVRLPADLREKYRGRSYELDGTASYSGFKRFRVTTDEVIKQSTAPTRDTIRAFVSALPRTAR
jgi:hypothetical protein